MQSKVFEAAKLYYEMGHSQEEIAAKLEITQSQVSKLLKEAKKLGIVREIISVPLATTEGDRIRQKYSHIEECLVVQYRANSSEMANYIISDELGKLGADHFRLHVKSNSTIALSGGTTLGKMVEHLSETYNIRNLKVYSVSIWCSNQIYELSPQATISSIVSMYPGSLGYCSQPPAFSKDMAEAHETKEVYSRRTEEVLKEGMNAQAIYIGLGDIPQALEGPIPRTDRLDFAQMLRDTGIKKQLLEKMAGECGFWPYDINGKILTPEEDDIDGGLERLKLHVLGIPLVELRRTVEEKTAIVCAIAGGPHKRRSVLGGLRAKIFNHLITDISCAGYATENF